MDDVTERALRSLIARSSDCVWRRDAAGYGACWAQEGEWRILGEVLRGRDAIVARWIELMAPFASVWQIAHNIVLGETKDMPVGRLYLEETLLAPTNAVNVLKGVYYDEFTHEDGAWRFARRHIDIAYLGPADWSGRWFPTLDPGEAPFNPDRERPATPSMQEAYGS